MISRSDWEPLPKPTLSPFARGYLSLCRFFTAAVWCVPALRVPLVHSLINHFIRQNNFSAVLPVDALVGIHGMWPHARPFCPARRAQSGRERAPRAPSGISAVAGLT